ncbi:MAG TPA: RraA family protein [Vicinamibacterales bacterium]|jgi:regulator of RNase E activity RraA
MSDVIARLAQLDTCAISDALDKLGLTGVASGIHRVATDKRICGRVVTAKLEPDDGRPAASRHLGTTAIETAQPGDVIVMEQRTGIVAAAWGGNLSLAAQLRGVAGTIVEGPARDVDEAHGYGYPVFARSRTPHTARGRIVEVGTNVPIVVGDISVSPGDYVVADGTGVVFVHASDIDAVLAAADAVAARERAMVAALREGTPVTQVMGINYETMLKR